MIERSAGVLMHITSLSSPYGIGTLGQQAYEFIDFLKSANMRYWQILPICPPSVGDSPYSVYSSFAGNPLLLDLDSLIEEGLLERIEVEAIKWYRRHDKVDFKIINKERPKLFAKVVERFNQDSQDFQSFLKENADWLDDYATFMTLIDLHKGKPWYSWNGDLKDVKSSLTKKVIAANQKIYHYHVILQYLFYCQWFKLLDYAHENGIQIIGDLPIYVGHNSSDVYGNPKLFKLDDSGKPQDVSGCPPDAFAVNGQKWNNPLYDWDYHRNTGYAWWKKRIAHHLNIHDALRIDHFRGFDAYYAIPYSGMAKDGHWEKGPGIELFDSIKADLGNLNLIAEDLGFVTPSLKTLLLESSYPGMKVIQFAFDSRDNAPSDYLPHRYPENCVAYSGTHDNNTLLGWLHSAYRGDIKYLKDYIGFQGNKDLVFQIMKIMWMSKAKLVIVQAQDLLQLDGKARMNTPSTTRGNWIWRAKPEAFTYDLAQKIAYDLSLYERENFK